MSEIVDKFSQHVASVTKLMNFDRDVLNYAIETIRPLPDRLKRHGITNPEMTGERALQVLSQIRENDSLRLRYQSIFNQALVLLVSYFASSVHEMFRCAVEIKLRGENDGSALFREDLRLSLGALKEHNFEMEDIAPELLVQAKDISFQDMGSVARAFDTYLEIDVKKNQLVNDIILGQACRHVIVHDGGRVNGRLLRQIASAKPRSVKLDLAEGQTVQFFPDEVDLVARAMTAYIADLAKLTRERFKVEV